MPHVTLRMDGGAIAIELDAQHAPSLAAAIARALPHPTLAVHCQVAGAEFCVPMPFFHWHENRRRPRPGDVGYASFGNYLCFYYGDMAADDGPTNVVGRVDSPLGALEALGRGLLKDGAQRAFLGDAEATGISPAPLPLPPSGELAALSRALLESTLTDPPDDVARLRAAPLPAMGNVAGRLQASVLLLALADVLMNARTLAHEPQASFAAIVPGLRNQMTRYARWLAMAGLPGTADWLVRARDVLQGAPPDAAILAHELDEALVAIARLRFWVEAISPWHRLDDDYRGGEARWSRLALPFRDESPA